MKAIPSGQYRYDCEQCDNFSFCERCFKKNTKHVHKFKRLKNSNDLAPPENCEELIAQSYMLCSNCKDSLLDLNKRVYICKECSPDFEAGNIVYWCQKCKETTEHEHKRSKFKGFVHEEEAEGDGKKKNSNKLDMLLQEYYDLDCEDVIAGGSLKTRFKYTNVPKEDFGLTEEEIFLLDDRQLNKIVSMKKLRPYRHLDETGQPLPEDQLKKARPNIHRIRKLKQEFKEEIEQKRRLVKENQQAFLELQKEQLTGSSTHALSKAERKQAKQEKKNKQLKYQLLAKRAKKEQEQADAEADQSEEEPEEQPVEQGLHKKKKRMAAYQAKK